MPEEPLNELAQLANSTGLPANLRVRAINWIVRLVGGTIAHPLVAGARERMDTVEGRSRVNMALADAVARQAVADPQLMERAKARFLSEQFRRQENIEAIAQEALADLSQHSEADPEAPPEPEEDWLNAFSRYAEDASSEKMRRLFGRVLSGEIRRPGTYSLTTLRFLSELDKPTAEAFRDVSRFVTGDWIHMSAEFKQGKLFEKTLLLDSAGLMTGTGGGLGKIISPGGYNPLAKGESESLVGAAPHEIRIEALFLTRAGKELLPLVREPGEEGEALRRVFEALKGAGFSELAIGQTEWFEDGTGTLLSPNLFWKKEIDPVQG